MIVISHPNKIINVEVNLPASKSISNRLLVIQFLMQKSFEIEHLSNCNDTNDLIEALNQIHTAKNRGSEIATLVDAGEAGTSYRFLTALLATLPGNYELIGSEKLMQRPINTLVDVLRSLGATIVSKNNNSFGPLLIKGSSIEGGHVKLEANTSSQFISALMLVAPYFKKGLTIELIGNVVSWDYIKMTMELMKLFGATVETNQKFIHVSFGPYQTEKKTYRVESDWTAASYWYAFAMLSKACNIVLKGLNEQSFQGDSIVASIFRLYGIKSQFSPTGVTVTKSANTGFILDYDFVNNPDLVQTFAFLHAALGLNLQINNAANLRHKETDRIAAIAKEIEKIGGNILLKSDNDFYLQCKSPTLAQDVAFETYKDHRMAMSMALLALRFNEIKIANPKVVDKSYPDFWQHLTKAGFTIEGSAF